jgi:hypothetical protein
MPIPYRTGCLDRLGPRSGPRGKSFGLAPWFRPAPLQAVDIISSQAHWALAAQPSVALDGAGGVALSLCSMAF